MDKGGGNNVEISLWIQYGLHTVYRRLHKGLMYCFEHAIYKYANNIRYIYR